MKWNQDLEIMKWSVLNLISNSKGKKPTKGRFSWGRKQMKRGLKKTSCSFHRKFRNIKDRSVQEQWDCLEEETKNTMDTHVPSKSNSTRHNLPWFGRKHRRLTWCKQRLYYKAIKLKGIRVTRRHQGYQKTGKGINWFRKLLAEVCNEPKEDIFQVIWQITSKTIKSILDFCQKTKRKEVGISDLKVTVTTV